jgi:hypothetical protein
MANEQSQLGPMKNPTEGINTQVALGIKAPSVNASFANAAKSAAALQPVRQGESQAQYLGRVASAFSPGGSMAFNNPKSDTAF